MPKGEPDIKHPAIIMGHGFTTTIDQMTADSYAERLSEAGFAVLLYDHRNLGISDGEPRQEINFWVQTRGYLDALDFLMDQPGIAKEQVAVWGTSMSAREAFVAASIDERINAVINLVPAFGEPDTLTNTNPEGFSVAKQILSTNNIASLPHHSTKKMAIVSHDQLSQPSRLKELTAYKWFMEHGCRFGSNWENVVTISTTRTAENFHASDCAPYVKAPVLMIVARNDEMEGADPEVTKQVFKRIQGIKEWVDISGGHFGLLYHPSLLFEKSLRAQINFLNRHLSSN